MAPDLFCDFRRFKHQRKRASAQGPRNRSLWLCALPDDAGCASKMPLPGGH